MSLPPLLHCPFRAQSSRYMHPIFEWQERCVGFDGSTHGLDWTCIRHASSVCTPCLCACLIVADLAARPHIHYTTHVDMPHRGITYHFLFQPLFSTFNGRL